MSPLFISLSSDETLQIVQGIFPVFAGYIGASVMFLFKPTNENAGDLPVQNK